VNALLGTRMTISFAHYRFAIIAVTALAALAPLSLVLYQSFLTAPLPAPGAQLGLEAYRSVFSDEDFAVAFGTTLLLGSCMTLIAVPLGSVLAFLTVRTDLPGRKWLEPLILIPVFVSTLVLAFGYVFALGPVGFLTTWFKEWTGFVLWNLYSFPFLVVIAGLIHVAHVYLYAAAALRGLDSELEEVARATGARPWKVALDVSLPMAMPAIFCAGVLVFFLGFELFGLPLVLGDPQGVLVLTTYLYKLPNKMDVPPYQLMAVVAAIMVAIALPLVVMQRILLGEAQRYVSRRGKALPPAPFKLGRWRWPLFLAIALWLAVTVLVPLAGLALRSFVATWEEGVALSEALTLDHYRQLLEYPDVVRSMVNTLGIGFVGGAAAVAFYAAIAIAIHRWPSGWARAVDLLVMAPRAMPGLVAGLAILLVFLFFKPLAPLRQTLISVWLAYTVVWLAYGMRLVSGALLRVAPELEDVARSVGASSFRANFDVTLPLLRTGMLAIWPLIFLIFVREYSTGFYLLGPGTEVVGSLLVSLWGTGAIDLVSALSVVNVVMIGVGLLVAGGLGVRLHG
jgi:iron(III) transport system permease protein